MMGNRVDGRALEQIRSLRIERAWSHQAEGSALIHLGNTRVLCTASLVSGVPRWLSGEGKGWVTAEYSMLPRSTHQRMQREAVKGKIGGRTHEISRFIGRSLRSIIDLKALGEHTILLDCDVLQADGGTRTSAITGSYIALADAITWGKNQNMIPTRAEVLKDSVAAISVGIVDGRTCADLCYKEDSRASTDMNVVMTGKNLLVEVQATAEQEAFKRHEFNTLLDLAQSAIQDITEYQREVLAA